MRFFFFNFLFTLCLRLEVCGYNEFIMATRRNTDQKVTGLVEALSKQCKTHWTAGAPIPTVRELTLQYNVSTRIVSRALQQMEQDGVLYTVPRVGVFVRSNERPSSDYYLFVQGDVLPMQNSLYDQSLQEQLVQVQQGFEDGIAQLGGASITVNSEQALQYFESGNFPPLSGVLDISWFHRETLQSIFENYRGSSSPTAGLAYVRFGDKVEAAQHHDLVSFDDIDGGRKATRHLMSGGHRRIAFLGLHAPEESLQHNRVLQQRQSSSNWSIRRLSGWQETMQEANLDVKNLAFHPPLGYFGLDVKDEVAIAQRVAKAMTNRKDITAVVAANDAAALGFINALRAANIATEKWPAIVGFDALPQAANNLVTSLRISWREIGFLAAEILVQRKQGKLTGPPIHRQVPVKLVQRLSSQPAWSCGFNLQLLESNHIATNRIAC